MWWLRLDFRDGPAPHSPSQDFLGGKSTSHFHFPSHSDQMGMIWIECWTGSSFKTAFLGDSYGKFLIFPSFAANLGCKSREVSPPRGKKKKKNQACSLQAKINTLTFTPPLKPPGSPFCSSPLVGKGHFSQTTPRWGFYGSSNFCVIICLLRCSATRRGFFPNFFFFFPTTKHITFLAYTAGSCDAVLVLMGNLRDF